MNKAKLLKYIKKEADVQLELEVLDWIDKSKENKAYFIRLKNTYVRATLPMTKVGNSEVNAFLNSMKVSHAKVKPNFNIKNIISYGLAASIAVGLFLNLYILGSNFKSSSQAKEQMQENLFTQSLSSEHLQTFYTDKGIKAKITLPDSSIVWLNSDSKLIFPYKFIGDTREVYLAGEGYFKVKKDSLKPMVVRTNKNFYIKVLGTEFNLSCYDNDSKAKAVLYNGKINLVSKSMATGKEKVTEIKPLEYCLVEGKSISVVHPVKVSVDSLWKDGFLIFESEPMEQVIKKLERWHGAQFTIKDRDILRNKINANFKGESLVQIMDLISLCTDISYTIDGVKVVLSKK